MNPFDENETQHSSQEQGGPFEVVFHIPRRCHNCINCLSPACKKLPVAGYDVKTLKQQVRLSKDRIRGAR